MNWNKTKLRIKNRTKKRIGWEIYIIGVVLLIIFYNSVSKWWWAIFIFIILEGYLLKEDFEYLMKSIFGMVGLIIVIFIIKAWQKNEFLLGWKIDNNFMIVLLTATYVIFTIMNVITFKKSSEINRLPYLKLYINDDLDIKIVNESDKIATNIDVTIHLEKIEDETALIKKMFPFLKKKIFHKERLLMLEREHWFSTKEILKFLKNLFQ